MFRKTYCNFVRPSSPEEHGQKSYPTKLLNGEEAKRLYLEEVKELSEPISTSSRPERRKNNKRNKDKEKIESSDKDLFVTVQNNDVPTLKRVLESCPDKINAVDEFGWSLLMIACQANSVETVRELLKYGINTSVRDKAGNSAQSLVIKNKNLVLADILLSHRSTEKECIEKSIKPAKVKRKEEYSCEVCNNTYPDKLEHLSSTIHNINASKGKKMPTNFVIPESNKGYQIMLKVGWDKESGLGPDGSGKKYPIKTVQKKDRKGLGLKKKEDDKSKESIKHINRKILEKDQHNNRRLEINFRREFY